MIRSYSIQLGLGLEEVFAFGLGFECRSYNLVGLQLEFARFNRVGLRLGLDMQLGLEAQQGTQQPRSTVSLTPDTHDHGADQPHRSCSRPPRLAQRLYTQ